MQLSGKFVLRIPPQLHRRIKEEAQNRSISLNQLILERLTSIDSTDWTARLGAIREAYGRDLLGVLVFGSSVRGEMRATSDIDLLIVLGDERPIDRGLYRIWDTKVQGPLGQAYSPQFVHLPTGPIYSSLWLEVALEGEILEDQENSIRSALHQIRNAVATGKYIRKFSHGHPYWIRHEEQP